MSIQLSKPDLSQSAQMFTPLHLKNKFLFSQTVTTQLEVRLSKDHNLFLSGNIYTTRKDNSLPEFLSSVEINKRDSITDFGMIGIIKLPLIQKENWSLDLNGKVRGAKQYLGTSHQRNRWNFEHQIGWNANYHFNSDLKVTLGAYHYRIADDTKNDDNIGSYINSGGGFTSLHLIF